MEAIRFGGSTSDGLWTENVVSTIYYHNKHVIKLVANIIVFLYSNDKKKKFIYNMLPCKTAGPLGLSINVQG